MTERGTWALRRRIELLLTQPLGSLDAQRLQREIQDIGKR